MQVDLGVPKWLQALLSEEFFRQCAVHESSRKNEKNIFCLDCRSSFCPQCLSPHSSHRLIQIRRYVYQNVIRLDDIEKLIDCAFVQSYINNSAKVVFINDRPQTRPFRVSGHVCITCDRPLQDPYHFCSLSCKVNHLANSEEGISTYLYECNYLPLPDIDVSHFTPDSVLDSPNFSSGNNSPTATVSREPPPPGSIVIKKKRPSLIQPPTSTVDVIVQSDSPVISFPTDPIPVCFPVNMKRRKGAPTRSPLY
ncbi:PLATZ transcription factor family protein [Zostera marina]|uniref:PLATZ transcription factor family protein n=1 Tax=Zostera marina TaxID=29655 RepID=A0A0K9NQP9_ZOSMR|nr:PLATZ transcription factor family protein [Zostera marina]